MIHCTLAVAALALRAGPTSSVDYAPAIELSRTAIEVLYHSADLPAVQVAVSVDGAVAWSDAFGFADVDQQELATPETRIRIASVSKSLTGTVAALLAQEGTLDLDAPIQTYVPTFPDKGVVLTSRQLAGHLGGVRHYRGAEIHNRTHYDTLTDALTIFAADDLVSAPGEAMHYSTYGYTLLGCAMEGATGKPYVALMTERLFVPLGMDHTAEDVLADMPQRARPYSRAEHRTVESAPTDHSYKVPGGGFVSTAEDLVRFGAEIAEPHVLDAAAVTLALTPMRTHEGTSTGYGMGWSRRRAPGGQTLYGHSGGQPGSRTYLLVDPEHDVSVALLTNLDGAPMGAADAERIRRHFVAAREGRSDGGADIDPAGEYDLVAGGNAHHAVAIEIRPDDGALVVEMIDGDVHVAFPRVVVQGHRVVAFRFTDRVEQMALRIDDDDIVGTIDGPNATELTGRRR